MALAMAQMALPHSPLGRLFPLVYFCCPSEEHASVNSAASWQLVPLAQRQVERRSGQQAGSIRHRAQLDAFNGTSIPIIIVFAVYLAFAVTAG